ncbi:dTDP-4-dehydrorhamnose reductase family protein [Herbaspirillum sp. NPDC101397]|uniref:dTDP-4-dehydrorhamnose reductase family protein n=1 Tax=Herbaspirillum sp. NPDC101397 TaxID=3364006 RepID=UPI00383B40F8
MRILILGASGMLGNAMLKVFAEKTEWEVFGTLRNNNHKLRSLVPATVCLLDGVQVEQDSSLMSAFIQGRPDVVVNCIGLVKQLADADDPLQAVPINTLLPHRLARLCELSGARLIHMSTDCVFSGMRGNYSESDVPDALDLYGRSKLLGELDYPHTLTLRTSIIGHELNSAHGLVNWFLSQHGQCKGYRRSIFSGLPTVILAQMIRDIVIPRGDLNGIYHVAANVISKYDLLKLIADVYKKDIRIEPDDEVAIDRSLNGARFLETTGYTAPGWRKMIETMHTYQ